MAEEGGGSGTTVQRGTWHDDGGGGGANAPHLIEKHVLHRELVGGTAHQIEFAAEVAQDRGALHNLRVAIDHVRELQTCRNRFSGSGPYHPGPTRAPPAILVAIDSLNR